MSTIQVKLAALRKERGETYDKFKALAEKDDFKAEVDQPEFDKLEKALADKDAEIERLTKAQAAAAASALPVAGQFAETKPAGNVKNDAYEKDKSLIVGAAVKMFTKGGGNIYGARQASSEVYGESHPVTKALNTSDGASGGFIIPPDYMNEIIPLLRAAARVRQAGPRVMPMPRGTMTIPGQKTAASASYGAEGGKIAASQPSLRDIVASYKKLTALVPISNDMMRYADPAVDAFVRDDLVKVMALAEDLAFLQGAGTQDSPKGFLTFANEYAAESGGTAGTFSSTAASTAASGGNFITTTAGFNLSTVANELGGLVNKLDTANVPDVKRVWFMHPRSKNYLLNVQNSVGAYVYRDEIVSRGTVLGYPIYTTTQIPINLISPASANSDCSYVMLAEMDATMLLDSMQLQIDVSREGTYVDTNGTTISAFQYDQTIIRAIAEHDFQVRHRAAVAVCQFVRWAPAIS